MTNKCEVEVDKIRLALYEETKSLTQEERIQRSNENARKLAEEFGFIIVPSANSSESIRHAS